MKEITVKPIRCDKKMPEVNKTVLAFMNEPYGVRKKWIQVSRYDTMITNFPHWCIPGGGMFKIQPDDVYISDIPIPEEE